MKTLSSFAIYERGDQKVVFTNSVKTRDLGHLADLRYCPATFQEHVPKALELRTTIVGDRVFTASIDSQRSEKTSIDWRRDGFGLIADWEPYELPAEVEERLMKLMRPWVSIWRSRFHPHPDGHHVFLEVNPVGEFFWLEKYRGLPLSGAIADLLVSSHRAQ